MGERLARLLDLPEGRGPRAARMLALVFLLSAGLSLMKSAQSGIFLSVYPRTVIPWAFAASSVALAAASSVLVRASGTRGVAWLGGAALVISSVSLLALRALLEVHEGIVPFVAYVVIEASSGVLIIQVWAVASAATDARTARRLLPVAGIGGSLAWTLAGFVTGHLVHAIGAPNLLIVGAALLGAAWAVTLAMARFDLRAHDRAGAGRREGSVLRALSFVNRVPLLRMMAVLSVLALIAEEVMDYHLMSVARAELGGGEGGAEAISAFFARYYAVTSLLGVILLAGPAARALGLMGAVGSLAATPAVTAAAAIYAAIVPGLGPAVLLRGAGRVLKQTLWSNAQEQMTSPVSHARRAQARAATRGVLAPGGYAVAAVLLSLVPGGGSERWLALIVLAISVAMVAVIVTRARRHYFAALTRAVDARRLFLGFGARGATVEASEGEYRELGHAVEASAGDAEDAAEVLGHAPPEIATPSLTRGLTSSTASVRLASARALGRVASSEPVTLARILSEQLMAETDPDVAEALATSLRRVLDRHPEALRSPAIDAVVSAPLHPRAAAAAKVIAICRDTTGVERGSALLPLLSAGTPSERSAALEALTGEAAQASGMAAVLRQRLERGEARERLEVAEAIVALGLLPLLPDVVMLLRDPRIGRDVARLLVEVGGDAFGGTATPSGTVSTQLTALTSLTAVARRAGTSGTDDGLVLRLLVHRDRTIRVRALAAMADAVHKERRAPLPEARVAELLETELKHAYRWVSILAGIAQDDGVPDFEIEPAFQFLAAELEQRIEDARRATLDVLLASGAHDRVLRAVEAARRAPSAERDAYVAELLELTLPARRARGVVPLFERLSLRERLTAGRRAALVDENAMAHPLDAIVGMNDPLLRKVAALTYGERHAKRFPDLAREDAPDMPRIERMRFLRSAPLFRTVPSEALFSVAGVTDELSFAPSEHVFHEGDPGEDLFLVMEGAVSIERGGKVLRVMKPGDPFGDLAVLDHQPRSADAVCREAAKVLRLRGADLRELMSARPEITEQILQVVVGRLRETTKKIG